MVPRRGVTVLVAVALTALGACSDASGPGPQPAPQAAPSATAPLAQPEPTRPTLRPLPTPSDAPEPRCPGAPEWDGTGTAFGANASTNTLSHVEAVTRLDATFGRIDAVRIFDPTAPPWGSWGRRLAAVQGRVVSGSFKLPPAEVLAGRHDAQLLDYFRTVPPDVTLFWTYYHEVEQHIDAGTFTAAEFRRAFRHIVGLAKRVCRDDLYPTLILTGYTVEPESGRDWRTYYPGDEHVSVLGWDPYNSASRRPSEYADPARLFGPVIATSVAAGKPFAIAETGSRLVPGDRDGRGRARWLRAVGEYLHDQGAVFVTYYHSIGVSGADYRLRDRPSVRAWRDVVARLSRG